LTTLLIFMGFSQPDALRRGTRSSSMSRQRTASMGESLRILEQKTSEEEAEWQRRLRSAADRLGYDISMYSVRKVKGVSDFYQDLFKES
jgi:hypothetical protein